jgi:hypothetical protein
MSFFVFSYEGEQADPLAAFRVSCRETIGESSFPAIERITAVGAYYSKDGLSSYDEDWLATSLSLCERVGIPVSRRFRFTPLNLVYGGEHDFLRSDLNVPTDLLLICFVFNPSYQTPFWQLHEDSMISPHHFEEGAWYHAAERSGAKVIIPFAARQTEITSEINKTHFSGPQYVEICSSDFLAPLLVRQDFLAKVPSRVRLRNAAL